MTSETWDRTDEDLNKALAVRMFGMVECTDPRHHPMTGTPYFAPRAEVEACKPLVDYVHEGGDVIVVMVRLGCSVHMEGLFVDGLGQSFLEVSVMFIREDGQHPWGYRRTAYLGRTIAEAAVAAMEGSE